MGIEVGGMSEWIKFSEEIPEQSFTGNSKSVLIYCPDVNCKYTACYNYKRCQWVFFPSKGGDCHRKVSHWMPLPDAPAPYNKAAKK
jgi:hypothetical protein